MQKIFVSLGLIAAFAISSFFYNSKPAVAEYYSSSASTYGFKNKVINGDFQVWQRGTSVSANNSYGPDLFFFTNGGAAVYNFVQSSDVPTVSQSGNLSQYSLYMDCTTADGALGDSDYGAVRYVMEGQDWASLAQQGFTVSFWVKATVNGIYCFSINNGASGTPDRAFMRNYSITSTATWEKKTIYVPPSPSAGTWNYTNGVGARFYWTLFGPTSGTGTYSGTSNESAWQTVSQYLLHSTSQVNSASNAANEWRISQIQIEPGTVPTSFDKRPIGVELPICQRYCYIPSVVGYYNVGYTYKENANLYLFYNFPIKMRTTPVFSSNISAYVASTPITTQVAAYRPAGAAYYTITSGSASFAGTPSSEEVGYFSVSATTWSGTNGDSISFLFGPDVKLIWSADF